MSVRPDRRAGDAARPAVGVPGSAHTKATLSRGRDLVVELDIGVVEAHVEELGLLGVEDDGRPLRLVRLQRRRRGEPARGRVSSGAAASACY